MSLLATFACKASFNLLPWRAFCSLYPIFQRHLERIQLGFYCLAIVGQKLWDNILVLDHLSKCGQVRNYEIIYQSWVIWASMVIGHFITIKHPFFASDIADFKRLSHCNTMAIFSPKISPWQRSLLLLATSVIFKRLHSVAHPLDTPCMWICVMLSHHTCLEWIIYPFFNGWPTL